MKIEFPLWLVTDPDPTEDLAAIRPRFDNFGQMERFIEKAVCPNGALYTTEDEATADAQARLDARDGKAEWVPLSDLRPGAIFETKDGLQFLKTANSKGAWCECFDLDTGQRSAGNTGASLVREVKP